MTTVDSVDTTQPDPAFASLDAEFAGVLPPTLIRAETYRAEADLRGQVPPGSMPELVHRLARERLTQRLREGETG
jgi:hypothetical protein